jgi:hypothetical protein
MVQAYRPETITAAGVTISLDVAVLTDTLLLKPDGGAVTLASNVVVNFTGAAANGQIVEIQWYGGFTLSGNSFTINGIALSDLQAAKKGKLTFMYVDGAAAIWTHFYTPDLSGAGGITGLVLQDASLTLAKFPALERGYQWVGDATNRPAIFDVRRDRHITIGNGTDPVSVPITGAISITNAGVVTITPGTITNSHISPTAGIQVNKLAAMTPLRPVVTDANGFLNTQSQLTPAQGGLGADQSAANGFVNFVTGTAQVGPLTETIRVDVSFLTAGQGTYYVRMPGCTVTNVKARVTSALSATDAGTIQCQDASGTNMTAGLITIPLSSAHGVGVEVSPTAVNTFTAGQEMRLVVAKTTSGGLASVDVTFTRTALQ